MATSFDDEDYPSLSKSFDEQLKVFSDIDTSELPTNSDELQKKISSAIKTLEDLTVKISYLGVFSTNESFEELATNSMKFLLLPVLLGSLILKRQNTAREETLRVASIYFKDYLRRCDHYTLTSYADSDEEQIDSPNNQLETKKQATSNIPDLKLMNKQREDKIARYKEKKSLSTKLVELKKCMENPSHDEDVVREYFLTMIKHFIYLSLDELDSIAMELKIVLGMKQMKKENVLPEAKEKSKPLKPFLITKDDVQKKVFGAGYPSLPVLTVQEFYDKRVQDGWFPAREEVNHRHYERTTDTDINAKKDACQEEHAEEEEEEDIERLRQRDEWRDDHKRGWGNRYNRS